MYEFFKKFKQFFIGLGTGIAAIIALIFIQRNRDADVASDFDELHRTIGELRENIARASELRVRLESTNDRLKDELRQGTSELLFETEQLRLANSRAKHELDDRIGRANDTIQQIGDSTESGAENIARLREACDQLATFIQENGMETDGLRSDVGNLGGSDNSDTII